MNILEATRDYEKWLAQQTHVVAIDIRRKHKFMAQGVFPFFRATFYRWLQVWPQVSEELAKAPKVLGVGDLHVENFGTWRDSEGRLAWGVSDFDESWRFPYTLDLARLATSVLLAKDAEHLQARTNSVMDGLLEGYREAMEEGGRPLVLAEGQDWLRAIALQELKDPNRYWERMTAWPETKKNALPAMAKQLILRTLPRDCEEPLFVDRQAGLGSRGHQRFAAIAHWNGGWIAREAKALVPSAAAWIAGTGRDKLYYDTILKQAIRDHDPFFQVHEHWLVRRLAPDCTKIPITELPTLRDEQTLLYCMGWEVANVHLGTNGAQKIILKDLSKRKGRWLFDSAREMHRAIWQDYTEWRKSRPRAAQKGR